MLVSVPLNTWELTLRASRFNWPTRVGDTLVDFSCEVSFDAGTNWNQWGGAKFDGGLQPDIAGDPAVESYYRVAIPQETNADRRLRITAVVKDTLDTAVNADFENPFPMPGDPTPTPQASVGFTAVQSASAGMASSVSTPNIAPTGDDRLLIGFGCNIGITPGNYTSITFGAVTATQRWNFTFGPYGRNSGASITNPSTTAAAVTYTISNSDQAIFVGAMSFDGVDQTTPLDLPADTSSGTATSVSRTITSAVGDMVADCIATEGGPNILVGEGGTSRWEQENVGSYNDAAGGATEAGAASVVRGWSWDASGPYGFAVVNINAAAAAGNVPYQPNYQRAPTLAQ